MPYKMVDGKPDFSQPIPDESGSIYPEHTHYTVRMPRHSDKLKWKVADALLSIPGVAEAVPMVNHDGSDPAVEVFTHRPEVFKETAPGVIREVLGISPESDREEE